MLNTEKGKYAIYSDDYGVAFEDLIGLPIDIAAGEIEARVEETLLQDDRVASVKEFEFEKDGGKLLCSFVVESIYDNLEFSLEVAI